MEWHFGHNCKHYLPTLKKRRVLIDNYRKRADLVEQKLLSAEDLLVYLSLPHEDVIGQITTGEIKTKQQKSGKIMFQVSCAWQWDNCPFVSDGGQCFYFEPHDGKKISCLAELKDLEAEHPSLKSMPSEEEVRTFELKAIEAVGGSKSS